MMDQNKMPLLEAILEYEKRNPAFFRVPGHRFDKGINPDLLEAFGSRVFRCDLTEAEGLDDLHQPEGVILEAQQLAAECYGADKTWFLVNGTTCGNEAMVLSACCPGDKIILPRNVHKSVYMGLVLSGAVPVWIMPGYMTEYGIMGKILPETVEQAFQEHPDSKAVLIVSPTYYGTVSDLKSIADICHKHNALLLVDEAHGAHLGFTSLLPPSALQQDADVVVQSMHKTGSSLTMSSLLHLKGSRINPSVISDNLKMVMSTSPNYLLMASLDAARKEMALRGREHGEYAASLGNKAASALSEIRGCRVLTGASQDPTRLVFSLEGYTGYELHEILYDRYNLSMELSDEKNVVGVIAWGNEEDEITRLVNAVRELSLQVHPEAAPDSSHNENPEKQFPCAVYRDAGKQFGCSFLSVPSMALTPRDAHFSDKLSVPLTSAAGHIAGEMIAVYPPGIPLLYPGEIITDEIAEQIQNHVKSGCHFHGPADPELNTIRIIN
ncbi:MAG: aminotransferase class I/II-fold pyridoxal phosphate-dependent enzyme [Parasporobacterium sp.]|nr:aminotransferase class I/II-fold pyridoxal phosphate-dependent enzyme [Parasporobacterium sp.]